jgi:hypothetical protein
MKISQLLMTATVAMLLLTSCSKPGSDDTSATAGSMQFQLTTSNPTVVVNKTAAGTITWTSGSAYAIETKLEAKRNGVELEFKSSTAQQVNLFGSVITGLGNISIPAATYTEVEYKISLTQNGATPALELNGQYTNSTGTVTPVVFDVTSLFVIKAEQSNVVVGSGISLTALTTLDLTFVSSGITQAMMNSATVSSGKIVISASSNINLYNILVNNLGQFHHVDVTHH